VCGHLVSVRILSDCFREDSEYESGEGDHIGCLTLYISRQMVFGTEGITSVNVWFLFVLSILVRVFVFEVVESSLAIITVRR
jgi:hypothetical protein